MIDIEHLAVTIDVAHLPRALVLRESLRRWQAPSSFQLWLLCLDAAAAEVLAELDLEGVRAIAADEVTDAVVLRGVRASRSHREYAFASKPFLARHVLAACPSASRVTLLDADLVFLADPTPVLASAPGASIVVSPHRFVDERDRRRFGAYNAGWVTFGRNRDGLDALARWRDRCVESTPDYPVAGRFAEQAYLEEIADSTPGAAVVSHPGTNVGAWNLRRGAEVRVDGSTGAVWIDDVPLVCFHVHGLDRWSRRTFGAPAHTGRAVCASVHRPYVDSLLSAEATVARVLDGPVPKPASWGSAMPRPRWWRALVLVRRRARCAMTGSVVRARSG